MHLTIKERLTELMSDYRDLVTKAKSYGFEIKVAKSDDGNLDLYFYVDESIADELEEGFISN